MPLKPAPTNTPDDVVDFRILTDGDLCDTRKCGATAYVRVHILDDSRERVGTLHFCAHHFRDHELAIWEREIQRRATVLDERRFAAARP